MRRKTAQKLTQQAEKLATKLYGTFKKIESKLSYSYKDRVVLITGGSRGLGLVLARQLVARGARVALLARDAAELKRAADDLRAHGGDVLTLTGDVGKPEVADTA